MKLLKTLVVVVLFSSLGCGSLMVRPDIGSLVKPRISFSPQPGSGYTSSIEPGYIQEIQYRAALNNASAMFALVFAGGFSPWQKDFSEGEWTTWKISDGGSVADFTLKYALLKRLDARRNWWQLEVNDGDIIYEALLNTSGYLTERLRAQFSGEAPIEVPVSNDYPLNLAASQIQASSVERYFVREEFLQTPAGSFNTKYYRYPAPDGSGELALWVSERVPGGLVRYRWKSNRGDELSLVLQAYGSGTKTQLNSY
ncbi:MAG: hypothetical protein GX817_05590 [Elusimicrobia bacterium]|nr:hypothetical protein [Elusimicrobiota bacterium]